MLQVYTTTMHTHARTPSGARAAQTPPPPPSPS